MDPDDIENMTLEQAEILQVNSAHIHTRCVLHDRLPAELQGDRTEVARSLRAARAASAAQTWIAVAARLHELEHA